MTRRVILLMWNDALEIMPKSASLLQILCEMWKHELDTFDWDGSAFEVKKVFFVCYIFCNRIIYFLYFEWEAKCV